MSGVGGEKLAEENPGCFGPCPEVDVFHNNQLDDPKTQYLMHQIHTSAG